MRREKMYFYVLNCWSRSQIDVGKTSVNKSYDIPSRPR